jgi:hypothetical protein
MPPIRPPERTPVSRVVDSNEISRLRTLVPRFGILPGASAASRTTANCIYSILTRIGHFVDFVDRVDTPLDYDAVIATCAAELGSHTHLQQPCLLFDTHPYARLSSSNLDRPVKVTLESIDFELHSAARLTILRGDRVLTRDDDGMPILCRRNSQVILGLPIFLTPDIQRPDVFWQLARFLAGSIAELLGKRTFQYFDVWPDSYRSAQAITLDLDLMADHDHDFEQTLKAARSPCTLFACANQLHLLGQETANVEVACHGDVHRPFADPQTNGMRIERMHLLFEQAGFQPAGFSPPHLIYTSPIEELTERFRYVRMGYMERQLLLYPRRAGKGVLIPVSFYPDHAVKYVAEETFAAMTDAYLQWSRVLGGLSVLCYHPGIYPGLFKKSLFREHDGTWTVTLKELSVWWNRRYEAMQASRVATSLGSSGAGGIKSEVSDYECRIEKLSSTGGGSVRQESVSSAQMMVYTRGDFLVVDNSLRPARRNVHAEIPEHSWMSRLHPWKLAHHVFEKELDAHAKNGFHACFYGTLGFKTVLEVDGKWTLKIPFLAANELLVIKKPRSRLMERVYRTTNRFRRLAAALHRKRVGNERARHLAN